MNYLDEFKKGINPHGIPYKKMERGKTVTVDIPFYDGSCIEAVGVLSRDLWLAHSCGIVYGQIKLIKQNTGAEKIEFSKGLYAIYPEKIKEIF